jgi:hypothetical protein
MRSLCVSCEERSVGTVRTVGDLVAGSQDKHRFGAHHGSVTDVPPESHPVPPPEPDPHATRVLPPDQAPPPPKQRFADRLWSLRAVIAVALASVILGGLAGAAIANAGNDDDRRGPMRFQRGGPMGPGGGQWQWGDGPGRGNDPMPRWRGNPGAPPNGVLPPNSAPTPSPSPSKNP